MRRLRVTVDIRSYWHAGTGRASGATLDAVVERDPDGLPVLPGRTLKGLLRHALRQASLLGHVPPERVDALFGLGAAEVNADGEEVPSDSAKAAATRYETRPGKLRVGSARLPDEWRAFARTATGQEAIGALFQVSRSTRLEEGVASDHTLRAVEVAVPMVLEAEVEIIDGELDAAELADLQIAAGLIRRIGKQRSRGLGRSRVTVEAMQ